MQLSSFPYSGKFADLRIGARFANDFYFILPINYCPVILNNCNAIVVMLYYYTVCLFQLFQNLNILFLKPKKVYSDQQWTLGQFFWTARISRAHDRSSLSLFCKYDQWATGRRWSSRLLLYCLTSAGLLTLWPIF